MIDFLYQFRKINASHLCKNHFILMNFKAGIMLKSIILYTLLLCEDTVSFISDKQNKHSFFSVKEARSTKCYKIFAECHNPPWFYGYCHLNLAIFVIATIICQHGLLPVLISLEYILM